uniref:CSON006372 protein n=1 Tax=Culicoides sonorensis TaxID=179676 RepID=A0A336LJF4_CULSO
MASLAHFSQKNTQDEHQSDTKSESSSLDSDWSDLKSIAAQLGISNVENLYTERFKIDRQKLIDMLKTKINDNDANMAELFFAKIMHETFTHISWPCRLKLGAKTKKDPHVRIIGHKDDVIKAKNKIMNRLDSRGNRVIMKMDVSYTDHSYIIGKGGNNIKRIMEETRTHIHFPDSNRSNHTEKSNQVSICGEVDGVELARSKIRLCTPLLYSFELPIIGPNRTQPDNDTPFVKEIERDYDVQIIFSSRPKLHSALVLIKGSEIDVTKVKKATLHLINLICGEITVPVQMQLEISIQHHPIVVGRMSANLREIMQKTETKIMFPDANDVNIKPIKRSQITISGTIEGVYLARQQLIGNLPIALIFDYPDSTIDSDLINKLMYTYDVFIAVRQKSRQSTLCVIIKGIEKFISNIYEARYQLLKQTGPRVVADIPSSYFTFADKTQEQKVSMVSLLATNSTKNLQTLSPLPPMSTFESFTPFHQIQSYVITSTSMPNISNIHDHKPNKSMFEKNANVSPRDISNSSGYQSVNCSMSSLENNVYSSIEKAYKLRNDSSDGSPLNDSLIFNFDHRIIDGYKAINHSAIDREIRTPNQYWKGLGLSKSSPHPIELDNTNIDLNRQRSSPFSMTTSIIDSLPKQQRNRLSQYNDVISILANLGLEHHIQHFINGEIDLAVFATLTDNDLLNLGIRTLGARRRILMAVHEVALRQQKMSTISSTSVFSGSAAPGAERRGSTGNI